jgi:hypothetical protein
MTDKIPRLRLRRHGSFFTTNEALYKNVNATAKELEKRPEVIAELRNFYGSHAVPNSDKIAKRLQLHLDWIRTHPAPSPHTFNVDPRASPQNLFPPAEPKEVASPPRVYRISKPVPSVPTSNSAAVPVPPAPSKGKTRRSRKQRKTRKQTNK